MNENLRDLLHWYRMLHDGISEMIEAGRLKESDIPDDYQWLVESLARLSAHPANTVVLVVECGCCGCYHRTDFHGDCREDSERFASPEDAEERLGCSVEEVDPEDPRAESNVLPPIGVGFWVGAGNPRHAPTP